MSRNIRCAHCRCLFVPNPRVKTQRFCSNKTCQRARKTRWQRDKMASDADYRANQREAQQSWHERHPHYWRQYRQRHADYTERNRILQHQRDHRPGVPQALKMDASQPVSVLKPGIYHLIPEVAAQDLAKMDVLSHRCRLIPIT